MNIKAMFYGVLFFLFAINSRAGINDTIAFEHVNVIPMTHRIVLENHRVIIANGKILSVEPQDLQSLYIATKTIDCSGKYMIPGLSEMHYHWRNAQGVMSKGQWLNREKLDLLFKKVELSR
ncbi:hypothetical protein [uncultured Draconibacterium sp.]|uniref:hypothetical protein n=1 Tax=uncultured Draconibacterium sp. TaxID=1573823 RepID=UPI0029C7D854|nr:hypothetical protein [uncultured Draconibacterium sp.]